ncbi:MAG: excinuclease ABC subunit UvrA [Opitutaceae bacterium]|nr:excinuclease ABC subunit UvrA [Opitutaceae bacterium]
MVQSNPNAFIRLRGVRQNNLKGFDLDLPLGKYIVVTGLSGAGKSSLVFETLHAEGQRRYVETFSAYTRQFLELLAKPRVDAIENIRPSIAIEQTNTVKTSRSTVGTMTELTDFFKVWFSHVAACFDPETGEKVEDDNPRTIWEKVRSVLSQANAVVAFKVAKPHNLAWPEILRNLKAQSYVRVLVLAPSDRHGHDRVGGAEVLVHRIDDLLANPLPLAKTTHLFVAQDRLTPAANQQSRFLEAVETALHFGRGEVFIFRETADGRFAENGHYSRGLHSPKTGRTFRAATPALFSFNSPLGACPQCRGFGRIIDIDYRLAIPDHSLSLAAGAIKPWEGQIYGESKKDLFVFARKRKIPTDVPFAALTPEQKDFVINGDPDYGQPGRKWPRAWYGLKGFFRYFETKTYKMHVRVFLSRYRAYNTCPACGGARLQPEALCWKWRGRTLPQLYALPVSDLLALIAEAKPKAKNSRREAHSADLAYDSIVTRLRYLQQVGLGYLTLDRPSRTLSGGEVERVNLTSCLGTSLVDTLFVLDEPSVGLHPRDINRLIDIIRSLTAAGNTVIVVEHDEAMIRAADHVVEIGPEPGGRGGHVVFQGSVAGLLRAPDSLTGAYLSGRRQVAVPSSRRPITPVNSKSAIGDNNPQPTGWLRFAHAAKHNLCDLSFAIPLRRFVCLSGVSGSGKSTLLDNVIHQGLLAQRQQQSEDPAAIGEIRSDLTLGEIVLVDQSPVSRTPRSNPALYTEAWEFIRELYAATPAAQEAGFSAGSFSFNSGEGRCDHCQGLGYERIEMQFLSDVFVPCAVCEGRRFKPEVLAITWNGRSISDLLATSINDALPLFAGHSDIQRRLASLEEVGLGYLTLGQPLNTLSGGEAQRLKLVRYLGGFAIPGAESTVADPSSPGSEPTTQNPKPLTQNSAPPAGALLLLDEPTTGLHKHDVKRLLAVLQQLVDRGHSVVVIEHNLDVLKSADWILEVGPDAGAQGGQIVAAGPPEVIARSAAATAPFLRAALAERSAFTVHDSPLLAAEDSAPFAANREPRTVNRELSIVGARENNLKNLSVSIPHHALSVVTGVSGSGKSTLAFDIVFAEGQRRFMESMSPYARQFVEQLPRPAIDRLTGIPPTVAIEQRVTRGSRKSTVATITEVAQYLRLLYARLGVQHHPETGRPVTPLSPAQLRVLLEKFLARPPARRAPHLYLCAPLIRGRKGHHQPIATWLARQGYELMRADGRLLRVGAFQKLDRYKEHDIEVVVADLGTEGRGQNAEGRNARRQSAGELTADLRPLTSAPALARALQLGKGSCFLLLPDGKVLSWFSTTRTDVETGESFPELDPKHFSFNSPKGWCPACRGHGRIYDWMLEPREDGELPPEIADLARKIEADGAGTAGSVCPVCHGERLNRVARAVKLHFRRGPPLSLPALLRLPPAELLTRLRQLALDARGRAITQDIVPQIEERLRFLDHVGLGYLSLDRPTETLSGGEAQRIRLAAQLGSNLSGVLYVLDEPSIGLHARDNERLIGTLESLRDKGNTLLVVEHDDAVMERADHIIDLGPGAGTHGGNLIASGTPAALKMNPSSLTGIFLVRGLPHPLRGAYREVPGFKSEVPRKLQAPGRPKTQNPGLKTDAAWLTLTGVRYRNLRTIDLRLPLGRLIMVCGPSGAGKSSLFGDVLHPAVACSIKHRKPRLTGREFVRLTGFEADSSSSSAPAASASGFPFADLRGANGFKSVIKVDQTPIGKTPRSTPATYLGIFDLIRQFFASLPEAKIRGYSASRFSFNTAGGRCETCQGAGRIRLEMAFMPDTYLPCENCGGLRYGPELADLAWKGKNIGQMLQLTFEEAAEFFDFHARLGEVCRLMCDCGLGYLTLGQSSPTLSGGEAQRLKLVSELARGLQTFTERSRGLQPRNLYLLEEPTIGLHLSDCEKLIRVLHGLVDQGHTVVVIEHHLDLLAEADWIVELGPGGGPAGGEILHQGPLAGLFQVRRSPTAPYLRAKLKSAERRPAPSTQSSISGDL